MKQIYTKNRTPRLITEGTFKNVKYAIVSQGTHPCAYVENIIKVKNYNDDKLSTMRVHGGFTYLGGDYWNDDKTSGAISYLGWDYAHCDDYSYYPNIKIRSTGHKWTVAEIEDEVFFVINQLLDLKEFIGEATIKKEGVYTFADIKDYIRKIKRLQRINKRNTRRITRLEKRLEEIDSVLDEKYPKKEKEWKF